MVENEFKYLLNYEQYERILKKYDYKRFIQINHYYDSKKLNFTNDGITFRIRQKDDNLQMQLKYPVRRTGHLSVKKEFSTSVKNVPIKINLMESEFSKYLEYDEEIYLMGSLLTERSKYNFDENIVVCLDKNYYLGEVDFELEIEFEENHREKAYFF